MKIPEKDPNFLLEKTLLGGRGRVHSSKESEDKKGMDASYASSGDHVNFSEIARLFQGVTKLASKSTDDRVERIEQIRSEIAAGTYQPDAKQVAEKIVRATLLDNIS